MNGTQGAEKQGFVYFALAKDFDAVKIGHTSNVEGRMQSLQTGCPCEIELLFAVPGDRNDERGLHQKFAKYRIHGEWFHDVGPIRLEIQELNKGAKIQSGHIIIHDVDEPYSRVFNRRFRGFLRREEVTNTVARLLLALMFELDMSKFGHITLPSGECVKLDDVFKAANVTVRSGLRAMNTLMQMGVIKRERDGRRFKYFANPFLFYVGEEPYDFAYLRFADTEWAQPP